MRMVLGLLQGKVAGVGILYLTEINNDLGNIHQ